jgi:hypothetical protein
MLALIRILILNLKESMRSAVWHRKLIVNVFLVLTFLYLIGNLLLLGILLDDVLISLPIDDIDYNTDREVFVLKRLNRYLLYYFFTDLLIRYFMQKLPAMSIQPYLHLPIPRASLVHFLLIRSVWSPFNLWHFILFIPFMFEVFGNLAWPSAMGWTSGFTFAVFASNFLLLYLKRTSEVNAKVYVAMLATLILIVCVHWFGWIDFNALSSALFDPFFLHPWSALVPMAIMLLAYGLNYRYLRRNMYLSSLAQNHRSEVKYKGTGILARFGLPGLLTELEFRFIWRNKRPRTVLLMTILFLGYGLLIFTQPEYEGNYTMYVLFSIIITGMFMLNYGQYLLGWEGVHFDHVLTRNVSFQDYYMGKFLLFSITSGAAMVLSIPYAYFGWEVLLVLFCVFLFNLGINSHFVMFFGSFNPKKIDLSKGSVFNWQGVGASQFLLVMPVLGMPVLVFFIGQFFWGQMGGAILVGVMGLLGLAGTRIWVNALASFLKKQRYEIANDFRNQ